MTQSPNAIRSSPWLIVALDMASTLGIAGAVYLRLYGGPSLAVAALATLGLLAIIGVVDAAVSRITLEPDALRILFHFAERRYERREIERVSWDAPRGVILHLTNGSSVKLPALGRSRESTGSVIRAWLAR